MRVGLVRISIDDETALVVSITLRKSSAPSMNGVLEDEFV